jgi:hypothetical protein
VLRFNDVLVSNEVFVLGYPRSVGLDDYPQFDPRQPLLRKGVVAGINRERHTIILDLPVYPGNSGGPVVQVETAAEGGKIVRKFRVIGIASEFVPVVDHLMTWWGQDTPLVHNSGYAIAASMDAVLDILSTFSP